MSLMRQLSLALNVAVYKCCLIRATFSMRTCPHCGCTEIDEDAARGDATCTGCGTVLEESIVVTENQFQERAGGSGHTLVGQFVSTERATGNALTGMGTAESREVTYQKGRKLIEEIGSQLRINQHCMDTAFNFFKMCVCRNLTKGRTRVSVVTSCLYMTCRLENTAHLLLDFSDITQVNVFELGRTLSFISRTLHINLPSTDPCLYILRFACMLEFGDKQKEVVSLATRLVQRMKRDWMATGRRPTGICGAALLIAARSLNFNRTIGDIVKVVHISDAVVRKRLDEFIQTPSGALTIDEFTSVDLEHCEDPPAFREARRRAREEQLRKESDSAALVEKDLESMEGAVEKALEDKRREKFRRSSYAKMIGGSISGVDDANSVVTDEILDTVYNVVDEDGVSITREEHYEKYGPSLESLGIRKAATAEQVPTTSTKRDDGNLSDISDSEIDTYILTDREAQIKEQLWTKINGETMRIIEQRKKEREELLRTDPAAAKKRQNANRKSQANNSNNDMEKVMQEKKLSNKVNYDILKEIETTSAPPPSIDTKPVMVKVEPDQFTAPPPSLTPRRPYSRKNKAALAPICSAIGVDGTIKAVTDALDATEQRKKLLRQNKRKPNISGAGKSTMKPASIVTPEEEVNTTPDNLSIDLAPESSEDMEGELTLNSRYEAERKIAIAEKTPSKEEKKVVADEGKPQTDSEPSTSSTTSKPASEVIKPIIKSRYAKARPNFKKPTNSEPDAKKAKT